MKILVIEDDPTVGQFVKRGLEQQRWGVDLVADGDEGEQLATTGNYDLIILDMRLPGKSGLQVLNSLRARGFERPVLVLTAQDAIDAKVATLRAGADDYVTKPFAFEELLARVEALSRRPRVLASPALKVADLELHLDTHHRVRVGLSLRSRHEHRRRRHQSSPKEDRRVECVEAHSHDSRSRLRDSR